MKTSIILSLALQAITVANAASPCKKDTCFSAVAVQQNNNPKYASRRSDCSSVLKTIYADEKTVTVTTTIQPTPVVVARQLPTPQITNGPEPVDGTYGVLEEREQIVAGGKKPAYASACKALKQYATACLCFGVRAATYLPGPTKTVTKTVVAPQPSGPRGPSCDDPSANQGVGGCSANCYCDARGPLFSGIGLCNTQFTCSTPCTTDSNCPAGFACIIGGAANVCGGSTCAAFTSCTSTFVFTGGDRKASRVSSVNNAVAKDGRFGTPSS